MSLLTKILNDSEFRKQVISARKEQEISYLETSFTVGLGKNNKYIVSKIQHSHDNASIIQDHYFFYNIDHMFDWIYIHFHGNYDKYSYPSSSDLKVLYNTKKDLYEIEGIKSRPIMGIASYKEDKKSTHLLLIQETKDKLCIENEIDNFVEAYEIMTHSSLTNQELVSYIINSGLFICQEININKNTISNAHDENLKYFKDDFSLREDYNLPVNNLLDD